MKFRGTLTQTIASYVTIDAADEQDAIRKVEQMREKGQLPSPVLLDEQVSAVEQRDDVVFRIYPDGEVLALLPEYIANNNGDVMSYMHNGQHGAADFDGVFEETREATKEEYADLLKEMTDIGYNLNVISSEESKAMMTEQADEEHVLDTPNGKCCLVGCNEGYGTYFEVYVQSDPRQAVYDILAGTINDTGNDDELWTELNEVLADYHSR